MSFAYFCLPSLSVEGIYARPEPVLSARIGVRRTRRGAMRGYCQHSQMTAKTPNNIIRFSYVVM